ncbi:MAG TPA: hypothetical protein VHK90_01435 [Thermoanaerobaculia bacterium]|nr:hypothetical protein [Thermoanaerobaculia bacterium]
MSILQDLLPSRRQWRRWAKPTRIQIVLALIGLALSIGIPLLQWERRERTPEPAPARSEIPELFDPRTPERYVAMGFDRDVVDQIAYFLSSPDELDAARAFLLDQRRHHRSSRARDFLNGLITSTWHRQDRHREGLEFLARETRELPRNDYRYRYQFYWHIRAIARIEGIKAAEDVIREMRRAHGRAEFSRVWIAAPFAAVEALRRGETPYDYSEKIDLWSDERKYLERVLEDEPNDRFRDHALYILERYETLLAEHPHSFLRDAALRTLVYRAVDCAGAPRTCNVALARSRLARLSAEYPSLARPTALRAAHLLAAAGRMADAESLACAGGGCGDERESMLLRALDKGNASASDVIAWLAPVAPRLLETYMDEIVAKLDRTPELARERDYRGALEVYTRSAATMGLNGVTPGALFQERLETFRTLVRTAAGPDANAWFAHGVALADAAPYGGSVGFAQVLRDNAAEAFARVEELAPRSNVAAKACYLRAAALRRAHRYGESLAEIEHFLETHHGSPLYDDMLAEQGVHYREIPWDLKRAGEIFARVASEFPDGNAADNALTYMAEDAKTQCRFADAFALYDRIRSRYAGSRLASAAHHEALALIPVVRSRFLRPGIPGLGVDEYLTGLFADVERGTSAEIIGLEDGMQIVKVDATPVATADAFHRAMAAVAPGQTVRLEVRDSGATQYVRASVQQTEHYRVLPPGSHCD